MKENTLKDYILNAKLCSDCGHDINIHNVNAHRVFVGFISLSGELVNIIFDEPEKNKVIHESVDLTFPLKYDNLRIHIYHTNDPEDLIDHISQKMKYDNVPIHDKDGFQVLLRNPVIMYGKASDSKVTSYHKRLTARLKFSDNQKLAITPWRINIYDGNEKALNDIASSIAAAIVVLESYVDIDHRSYCGFGRAALYDGFRTMINLVPVYDKLVACKIKLSADEISEIVQTANRAIFNDSDSDIPPLVFDDF